MKQRNRQKDKGQNLEHKTPRFKTLDPEHETTSESARPKTLNDARISKLHELRQLASELTGYDQGLSDIAAEQLVKKYKKGTDLMPIYLEIIVAIGFDHEFGLRAENRIALMEIACFYAKQEATAESAVSIVRNFLASHATTCGKMIVELLVDAARLEKNQALVIAALVDGEAKCVSPYIQREYIEALLEIERGGVDLSPALPLLVNALGKKAYETFNTKNQTINLLRALARKGVDVSLAIPKLLQCKSSGEIENAIQLLQELAKKSEYSEQIVAGFKEKWVDGDCFHGWRFFKEYIKEGTDVSDVVDVWIQDLKCPSNEIVRYSVEMLQKATENCDKKTRNRITAAIYELLGSDWFMQELADNSRIFERTVWFAADIMEKVKLAEERDECSRTKAV